MGQMGFNGVETRVYPETIPSQNAVHIMVTGKVTNDPTTYYLCDGGRASCSYACDPTCSVGTEKLSPILSACDRHWGREEFTKCLLPTFPMMTKKQIFGAWDTFSGSENIIYERTLENRHRKFGSIPQNLFCASDEIRALGYKQTTELESLDPATAENALDNYCANPAEWMLLPPIQSQTCLFLTKEVRFKEAFLRKAGFPDRPEILSGVPSGQLQQKGFTSGRVQNYND